MKKYYIYALEYADKIFYIGKTNNLKTRLSKHKSTAKLQRTHKENYINKLLIEGKNIEIKIIETIENGNEDEREIYWISYYKSIGYKLYNGTSGGEGGDFWSGKKHTEETKKKLREIAYKKIEEGKGLKLFNGEKNGRSKLTEKEVIELRELREYGLSYGQLAIKYNISKTTVIDIIKRRKWKHI
jgi:predicted DNA-binding protein (UPF0251 family)